MPSLSSLRSDSLNSLSEDSYMVFECFCLVAPVGIRTYPSTELAKCCCITRSSAFAANSFRPLTLDILEMIFDLMPSSSTKDPIRGAAFWFTFEADPKDYSISAVCALFRDFDLVRPAPTSISSRGACEYDWVPKIRLLLFTVSSGYVCSSKGILRPSFS